MTEGFAYLCNFWAIYSWTHLDSAQNNLIWLSAALSRPVDFQRSIKANYLFVEVGLLKLGFFPHVFCFFVICSSRSVTLINSRKACLSNSLFFLYYSSWILSWGAVLVTADALWIRMSVCVRAKDNILMYYLYIELCFNSCESCVFFCFFFNSENHLILLAEIVRRDSFVSICSC